MTATITTRDRLIAEYREMFRPVPAASIPCPKWGWDQEAWPMRPALVEAMLLSADTEYRRWKVCDDDREAGFATLAVRDDGAEIWCTHRADTAEVVGPDGDVCSSYAMRPVPWRQKCREALDWLLHVAPRGEPETGRGAT